MADHIKYAVSCDIVDEYTTTNTAAGDITGDIADVSPSYSRYHPSVGGPRGGNGEHDAALNLTVNADKIIADTATSLGTMSSIKLAFIRHSGFTSAARDVPTTATLSIIMGSVTIAVLEVGGALVLPFATATTAAITATASTGAICAEVIGTN
tara:strand:- start:1688 stop:2146 length:459 start_codon:yes stop_codon:yes gene_type:complete